VHRHDPAGVDKKRRKHRALTGPSSIHHPAGREHLHRAQQAKLHSTPSSMTQARRNGTSSEIVVQHQHTGRKSTRGLDGCPPSSSSISWLTMHRVTI
jgi:hypothetical protein